MNLDCTKLFQVVYNPCTELTFHHINKCANVLWPKRWPTALSPFGSNNFLHLCGKSPHIRNSHFQIRLLSFLYVRKYFQIRLAGFLCVH